MSRLGANAALVLARIEFACRVPGEGRLEDESGRWWRATVGDLAAETGLTVKQIRTAIDSLKGSGEVESEKHRHESLRDQTVSYRKTLSPAICPQGQMEMPLAANGRSQACTETAPHLPSGANVPIYKEVKDINPDEGVRVDVQEVCELLRSRMVSNGCRTPTISAKWKTDVRLLLDRDAVTLEDAKAVLEWSQRSDFWKANIHSPAKLRAKFDTLRLQMENDGTPLPATTANVEGWLRDCWQSYDTRGIETRSGLAFQAPDLPADVTDPRAFNLQARRDWITDHREEITQRIMSREVTAA